MSDVHRFIINYLEEFDEDSVTAIINGYRSHSGNEEGAVERVFDALKILVADNRITLAEQRDRPGGGENFKLITELPDNILSDWQKNTFWNPDKNYWQWSRAKDFSPYVILGRTRKWRSATPEEIAEEYRKYGAKKRL